MGCMQIVCERGDRKCEIRCRPPAPSKLLTSPMSRMSDAIVDTDINEYSS